MLLNTGYDKTLKIEFQSKLMKMFRDYSYIEGKTEFITERKSTAKA